MSIESSRELLKLNKERKVGEINYNSYKSKMKIIEYNGTNNIIVEFDNGWRTESAYSLFRKGAIKSPYDKSVYGVGYLGEGKYKSHLNNKIPTKEYTHWRSMLQRCYGKNTNSEHPTYEYCTVCEEWFNYQNFAEWYSKNYYEVEGQTMHLDKDVLYKYNKVYSPDTCLFVPHEINLLFTKSNAIRGEYPIGVTYNKRDNNFQSSCRIVDKGKSKKKCIGISKNPIEAFYKYKNFKENYIKLKADYYKNDIPKTLYDAMYAYEVVITD